MLNLWNLSFLKGSRVEQRSKASRSEMKKKFRKYNFFNFLSEPKSEAKKKATSRAISHDSKQNASKWMMAVTPCYSSTIGFSQYSNNHLCVSHLSFLFDVAIFLCIGVVWRIKSGQQKTYSFVVGKRKCKITLFYATSYLVLRNKTTTTQIRSLRLICQEWLNLHQETRLLHRSVVPSNQPDCLSSNIAKSGPFSFPPYLPVICNQLSIKQGNIPTAPL